MRTAHRLLALLPAAVLALSACASADTHSNPGGAATPAGVLTISGPSTAVLPLTNVEPITDEAHPVLPATVTDAQGSEVTVSSDDRILALDRAGTLAATVYGLGLGKNLVGRDQSTGFPAAKSLPVVTSGAHILNAEAILQLHPSVVITDGTLGPWDVMLQLRESGVPVVVVTHERAAETVGDLTDAIAAALGVKAEGDKLSARLNDEVAQASTAIKAELPADPAQRLRMVFLYVRGQAGAYYIFGKNSSADSLINSVGGIDVATEAGIVDDKPLTAEALANLKPDVILMMTEGLKSVGGVEGALRLPGIAQTPAGQKQRLVDMNDFQVLAFGPQTASVITALGKAIYAPEQS